MFSRDWVVGCEFWVVGVSRFIGVSLCKLDIWPCGFNLRLILEANLSTEASSAHAYILRRAYFDNIRRDIKVHKMTNDQR